MEKKLFQSYLRDVYRIIARGDAREESFYGALDKLISSYGQSINKKTDVTVLPKKSEAGNPDFRVWDGQNKITGYIEAKHPSKRFLDEIESSEQLKRYLEAYPNVILTNFLEFRLFRNSVLWDKPVKISDYSLSQKLPQFPVVQHEERLTELLTFFFDFSQPRVSHPKVLAEILAYKAGIMRDYIVLPALEESQDNYFFWLYQSFQRHLIKDLKKRDFADLFSQTFIYGLFIAKYQYEAQQTLFGKKISSLQFTTRTAYDFIQKSFGILREVFKIISTQDMPKNLEIIVDDVVDVLNHTEIYNLLTCLSKRGTKDPIFHLYETFLLKYDREKKKKLGVFYTPLEVVSYVVNSTHALLKNNKLFDASDGLASYQSDSLQKSVTFLDPALGTGTFFVNAIEKALEEVKSKYSSSSDYLSKFIRNHILSHFFAFEILIAPYVVSHLKVLFALAKKGFEFQNGDIAKIFLTNTLEFHLREEEKAHAGFFERVLVTEQERALKVKKSTPILVILGNPPYSVSSQNKIDPKTDFGRFYESYKEKVRIEEKNIQPLSDDYIKFLAFAHWKVGQTGKGIVGMITNNSYLDGLIHRDMRRKLLEDFDLVYILNLHGDSKRPKITKGGKKDENVFDIRQGVAISLFVKPEKAIKKQILYQELIGQREDKYNYLEAHNVKNSEWTKLKPKKPYCFFVPKDFDLEKNYQSFVSVTQIFGKNSSGIKTHRDHFILENSKEELERKLKMFIDYEQYDNSLIEQSFKLKNTKTWNLRKARTRIVEEGIKSEFFKEYTYRPFDKKWIYQSKLLVERLREDYLWQIGRLKPAIITTRQLSSLPFNHSFIVDAPPDICLISLKTKESSYVFPLWLCANNHEENNQESLLEDSTNIKKQIIDLLSSNYKRKILPVEIFYYLYAVLYSNIYRKKYEEFLKIDFPRIPFTKNYEIFNKLSKLGEQLSELHLLKSPLLSHSSSRLEGNNESFVKRPNYDKKRRRIYINEVQCFTNVDCEVWDYFIGGYQVLYKWLKDRKGKFLSDEEVNHYIKIIAALRETIKIQKKIDIVYPEIEKLILLF